MLPCSCFLLEVVNFQSSGYDGFFGLNSFPSCLWTLLFFGTRCCVAIGCLPHFVPSSSQLTLVWFGHLCSVPLPCSCLTCLLFHPFLCTVLVIIGGSVFDVSENLPLAPVDFVGLNLSAFLTLLLFRVLCGVSDFLFFCLVVVGPSSLSRYVECHVYALVLSGVPV